MAKYNERIKNTRIGGLNTSALRNRSIKKPLQQQQKQQKILNRNDARLKLLKTEKNKINDARELLMKRQQRDNKPQSRLPPRDTRDSRDRDLRENGQRKSSGNVGRLSSPSPAPSQQSNRNNNNNNSSNSNNRNRENDRKEPLMIVTGLGNIRREGNTLKVIKKPIENTSKRSSLDLDQHQVISNRLQTLITVSNDLLRSNSYQSRDTQNTNNNNSNNKKDYTESSSSSSVLSKSSSGGTGVNKYEPIKIKINNDFYTASSVAVPTTTAAAAVPSSSSSSATLSQINYPSLKSSSSFDSYDSYRNTNTSSSSNYDYSYLNDYNNRSTSLSAAAATTTTRSNYNNNHKNDDSMDYDDNYDSKSYNHHHQNHHHNTSNNNNSSSSLSNYTTAGSSYGGSSISSGYHHPISSTSSSYYNSYGSSSSSSSSSALAPAVSSSLSSSSSSSYNNYSGSNDNKYYPSQHQSSSSSSGSKQNHSEYSKSGYKLLVSNLHPRVTEDDVLELFSDIGPIKRARFIDKGLAEVVYVRIEHAKEAIEKYDQKELDGRPMVIGFADKSHQAEAKEKEKSKLRNQASLVSTLPPPLPPQPISSSLYATSNVASTSGLVQPPRAINPIIGLNSSAPSTNPRSSYFESNVSTNNQIVKDSLSNRFKTFNPSKEPSIVLPESKKHDLNNMNKISIDSVIVHQVLFNKKPALNANPVTFTVKL